MARVQTVYGVRNEPGDSLSRNKPFYSVQVVYRKNLAKHRTKRPTTPDIDRTRKPDEQR